MNNKDRIVQWIDVILHEASKLENNKLSNEYEISLLSAFTKIVSNKLKNKISRDNNPILSIEYFNTLS